jgi:hypothetical protein
MAITNTWSVNDMQHTDSDGGVFLVYWSMVAASDGDPSYTASEGGKLRCEETLQARPLFHTLI